LGEVIIAFSQAWDAGDLESLKIVKSATRIDDYRDEGLEMVDSYFSRVFCSDSSETIALEEYFEIPLSSYIYRGVIDRVSRKADGELRITDYKSGRRVPDPSNDDQLTSYTLWVFGTHDDNQIEICFEDLRNRQTKVAVFRRDQADSVKQRIAANIRRVDSQKTYRARKSVLCKWCRYSPLCDGTVRPGGEQG